MNTNDHNYHKFKFCNWKAYRVQKPPSPLKGSVGKDEGKKFKGSSVQVFLSRIRELENFFGAQWDFDKN